MVSPIAAGGGSQFTHITSATTTVCINRSARLRRICINKKVAASTVTIYDGIDASGTVIGIITNQNPLLEPQREMNYDVFCATGITLVTTGAQDITVVWD